MKEYEAGDTLANDDEILQHVSWEALEILQYKDDSRPRAAHATDPVTTAAFALQRGSAGTLQRGSTRTLQRGSTGTLRRGSTRTLQRGITRTLSSKHTHKPHIFYLHISTTNLKLFEQATLMSVVVTLPLV